MTDLASQLAAADIPCPKCKYNLRNLTADRCPECGEALTLEKLQAAEKSRLRLSRHDWPWTITLIALIANWSDAFHALWQFSHFGYVPYGDMESWNHDLHRTLRLLSTTYWLLVLPAGLLLLTLRRPFLRLPPWSRWTIATLTLLLFLFAHRRVWPYPFAI